MNTAALPTRKDEAWRYAAVDALKDAALDKWREITVAPGAAHHECLLVEDGMQPAGSTVLRRLRVNVGEGARCELFAAVASGLYSRIEIEARLGRGAHFEFGGITVGGNDSVREFVTRVIHAEPEASSNQVVRSVHWGKGTGNFLGSIEVAKHAQKTDAAQSFKGLLLEKGASVNTVPQLEIFADDVKCAHGASVGRLDETARFYMAARGLPPEVSRRLLVQAFVGDALVALGDDDERERLMRAALDKLDKQL